MFRIGKSYNESRENEEHVIMSSEEIKKKIVTLLEEELLPEIKNRNIKDDEHLEVYGMDSYAFVKMIVRIEEVFHIEVPNDLLNFSRWNTIGRICDCLSVLVL